MNDPFDCAYLAGILDAKSAFSIDMNAKDKKKGNIGQYAASLTVTTTSDSLVNYLKTVWGARSTFNTGSHRVYWNYNELLEIIPQVKPFMLIKKEHVDLMAEFLNHTGLPGYQSERMQELNAGIKKGKQGKKRLIKIGFSYDGGLKDDTNLLQQKINEVNSEPVEFL